jgi:hypothetical protein
MRFRIFTLSLMLMTALLVGACEKEGPAEQAGKNIDEAAEKTGDKLEDAADQVEDAADKVEEKVER